MSGSFLFTILALYQFYDEATVLFHDSWLLILNTYLCHSNTKLWLYQYWLKP